MAEKQKQVVLKEKTKIHTEAREFAFKVGLNITKKERKYNRVYTVRESQGGSFLFT